MNGLLKVSLRQQAIFIEETIAPASMVVMPLSACTAALVANMVKLGYGVGPALLHALNVASPAMQDEVLATLREVAGVKKNWTPLIKDWHAAEAAAHIHHVMTAFANVFRGADTIVTTLPCGHIIPDNTFPLERYNGCPFCGAPFESAEPEYAGQGSKLKVLDLWTIKDAQAFLADLLTSKTALDASQTDSLKILLQNFPVPAVTVGMKETTMLVIDVLIEQQQAAKAQVLFTSPADILRYLWYKHTGFLQVVEPKTILKRKSKNHQHMHAEQDMSVVAKIFSKALLKLKYDRQQCLMVARWLNNMDMGLEQMCESMHPKRAMWVRFIRALRLGEYSKRPGFKKLNELLDYFYNEAYSVWQGHVDDYRLRLDAEKTFQLLKQRPGLFARSLFANMLWFGETATIAAFKEVMDKVPARLILTLSMYADIYFDPAANRTVKPLGGVSKTIPANQLLPAYSPEHRAVMVKAVKDLYEEVLIKRFAAIENTNASMYIDPVLFKIPLSIGDRSETVQDMPIALQGTRFSVEGDTVRLFMQWGTGLKAQHLDMDLSCRTIYDTTGEMCYFGNLSTTGCKHSGDIREIPAQIGTAEYIDMNLDVLQKANARYVIFTCNAYSAGDLALNLTVGWMNSKYPMKVSDKTGVAYDPSCVQHQVRIVNGLSKGLVFGVLELATREIIWLEIPFDGQLAQNMHIKGVESMLQRLNSKQTIGQLLQVKAKAQGLVLTDTADADEMYTAEWARNTAAVTGLLVD